MFQNYTGLNENKNIAHSSEKKEKEEEKDRDKIYP